MALTVVVWNIEKFGVDYKKLKRPHSARRLRNVLIAQVLDWIHADILVIQELRTEGVMQLDDVRKNLETLSKTNWYFDWLPSSQIEYAAKPTFGHLDFTLRANSEGYAVLWRGDALSVVNSRMSAGRSILNPSKSLSSADYTNSADSSSSSSNNNNNNSSSSSSTDMVDDPRGGVYTREHYIELPILGVPWQAREPGCPIIFDPTSQSRTQLGFPQSICPNVNRSSYPLSTGKVNSGKAAVDQRLETRRPCVVQMNVGKFIVPLVVYHAPVGQMNSDSNLYGTLIGLALDDLQYRACAYAGDFNVIRDNQTILLKRTAELGFEGSEPLGSTIHYTLKEKLGQEGTSKQDSILTGEDVFGSSRDLAFYRGSSPLAPSVVRLYDLIREDLVADTNKGALRSYFTDGGTQAFLKKLFDDFNTTGAWDPWIGDCAMRYCSGTLTRFKYGDAYTAAAILYKFFVSDHLPLVIQYE
jgi:hypothetical protein